MGSPKRAACLIAALVAACAPAAAQSSGFGQNKIAYDRFDWKVYASPHFDVHYYGAEENLLQDVVSDAESAYLRISKELDHELSFRVPLVIYKTHQEFSQTNITLAELPEAVGAFAEPVQNRMVVPIDVPPDELYKLLSHELTHIFQYSIFFEGYLGRALRARPPTWLFEGMASYFAKDETNLDRMAIRDAVVNNFLPPIQALSGLSFLAYRYGHAVFDFIEQEQGKEGVRNFIYEYRKVLLTNNIEKAVKETFGYDAEEFNRRFNRYLRKKYFPVLLEKKSPDDYGKEIAVKRRGRSVPTFGPALSPSGELVAALAAPGMKLDLVVLSAEDGKLVRNLTSGWTNQYQGLVTKVFEGKRDIAWSPSGDQIAVFVKRENRTPLFIFNALTGKREREIDLENLYECAAPAFSPDGRRVAFEANLNGVVDIFELDLDSGEIRNVTQDEFFDTNPWYAADGKSLLYDRRLGEFWKIFSVDLSDPSRKTQLTFGTESDLQPSYSRDGNTIFFSSDRDPNGVYNLYGLDLRSGEVRQYTDVVGGCFAPVEMADHGDESSLVFVAFYTGTFKLYRMPLLKAETTIEPSARMEQPVEAEPFQPPLKLTLDESRKQPYKRRWDLSAPNVGVGLTDDGTFLSNVSLAFSDLLGDHRAFLNFYSVSSFSNLQAMYLNLKHRTNWGAQIFDYRDYFLSASLSGLSRDQTYRTTGGTVFAQYPISRYYRVEGSLGVLDRAQDYLVGTFASGNPAFQSIKERFVTAGVGLVGDTTRYQDFGPFQGKRFRIGVTYGANVGGTDLGDLLNYSLDFRTYRQLTRRSTLAWRLSAAVSAGSAETYYAFGGINQLRGFDFREFFGSRVAFSNLELRFPLVDAMRFPFMTMGPVRGFLFFDVGAAELRDGLYYDSRLGIVRADFSTEPPTPIKFKFWDSENNRLQDGRAAYGLGIQLYFAGLQLNWAWSYALPYTRYVPNADRTNLIPVEQKSDGLRSVFYIVYDF